MMKESNLLIYFHKIKSVTNLADKRKNNFKFQCKTTKSVLH